MADFRGVAAARVDFSEVSFTGRCTIGPLGPLWLSLMRATFQGDITEHCRGQKIVVAGIRAGQGMTLTAPGPTAISVAGAVFAGPAPVAESPARP